MNPEFESQALAENMKKTQTQNVELPKKYAWFLSLSQEYWGIHKRTEEFLWEYNHPYANNNYIIENIHNICTNDMFVYEETEEPVEAFLFIVKMIEEMMNRGLDEGQMEKLIVTLFKYIDLLAKTTKRTNLVIRKCLDIIDAGMAQSAGTQGIYVRNFGYFKIYLRRTVEIPEFRDDILRITKDVLLASCANWLEMTRMEDWYKKNRSLFQADYSDKIQRIGGKFFSSIEGRIRESGDWESLSSNLFFNDIANHIRRFTTQFEHPIEQIYYLLYLLHIPGMDHLKDHLLYDINRLFRDALKDLSPEGTHAFVDTIFDHFEDLEARHGGTILDCIKTLGVEIVALDDDELISHFIDRIIDFGFVRPGSLEVNKDWQTQVDPNHVKNIRVWLELFEMSPNRFKRLLSALVANIKLGGIFISDTDLFQRDITRLLNADIDLVFKQVKHLGRFFPVYFKEIGAEGALRDSTTSMDELSKRKDPLIHFVRKQIHTESNNTHIELIRQVAWFWYENDTRPLQRILPKDVFYSLNSESEYVAKIHQIMKKTCEHFGVDADGFLKLSANEIEDFLKTLDSENQRDKKRLQYLVEINKLLIEKYSLEANDVEALLRGNRFFLEPAVQELKEAMEEENPDHALTLVFSMMSHLKSVILHERKTEALENIYYKRHIAIGIPSMYGQYMEPKFEALGLMYRMEKFSSHLMERLLGTMNLEYLTGKSLKHLYGILSQFQKGLEIDGIVNENFNSNLEMLNYSLTSPSFTLKQYIDILQFMAQDVKEIINEYFLRVYDDALSEIVPQVFDEKKETMMMVSEKFYGEILSSAFLIQNLDNFIVDSISKLQSIVEHYSEQFISNMMNVNPDLVISLFHRSSEEIDNRVFLGAKAYYLKKLIAYGMPVPPGFVLTTEVFRHKDTIFKHPYMSLALDKKLKQGLAEVEAISGCTYGDPKNPLLFSIRSGTAISLPGAMSTFLNVGMNDEIAETLGRDPEKAWMGWDCYRRFLQSWGMAYGIKRNTYDALMSEHKAKHHVNRKIQFDATQMKELACQYKKLLVENDVSFSQDVQIQLRESIINVMNSWDSDLAKSYRRYLQIADEWGTAVTVQKMVMGNRSLCSGSGVVFTHNPKLSKPGINLYGDFTLCSQGEDIVSGLVHTLPISENQVEADDSEGDITLQSEFPEIYKRLEEYARKLIEDFDFSNQEIEFTFESDDPDSLYILQTRAQDISKNVMISIFKLPPEKMLPVGRGIGIKDGCLSGMVSFGMEDLMENRKCAPDDNHILVRPDTVPDDIPLIFLCDGLVTSRGGATSHAAVTASKLGKVSVVNCKELVVNDQERCCSINQEIIRRGEYISIDGTTGSIYLGKYPITYIE